MKQHQKPRVGIGVLVEQEGRILLGLRKGSHGAGTWSPPGGHLDFGELVIDCAHRELQEETGLIAQSSRLGGWVEHIIEDGTLHYITLWVHVDSFSGNLAVMEPDKCVEWRWADWTSLPQPLFAPMEILWKQRPGASI